MTKHKLELMWPDKDIWADPEPRILLEKSTYQGDFKGIHDNLLIYGDNLLGLKALEREYTGKVKCVYIDPPYNTKSVFQHYNDSFEHSLWLNMMKERLVLLSKLLRDDGSIWISIDADESHYLKVLCDEIFGRRNFIDEVIWQRAYAPINLKKTLSRSHDIVLVYAKNREHLVLNKLLRSEEANSRYTNRDNDLRGPWKSSDLSVGPPIKEKIYEITTPSGRNVMPPKGYCWRLTRERFNDYLQDNRIWFGDKGDGVPSIKRFLSEVKDGITPMTLWLREEVGDSQEAKREVKIFNDKDVFQTPKPERLLQRIIHLATNESDIVLDCFAGSGTTGAVAHKMRRRWIMVELNPHCHTHIIPRLQKVIDGEDEGGITKSMEWAGGGGFRYCELAPSLLEKNRFGRWVINKQYNPIMLAEAMCLHAGFTFCPKGDPWWMHGYSTESDFIYVTPTTLTRAELGRMSLEVGLNRTLLICCLAFNGDPDEFFNLTIVKIPKKVLNSCEWGKDDYRLKAALEEEANIANQSEEKKSPKSTFKATAAAKGVRKR